MNGPALLDRIDQAIRELHAIRAEWGMGSAFKADNASMVVGLGWGGLLFSFLCITFGAIAMGSESKIPGALLTLSALAGAILGGTLVAVFMVLALVAGILATMGAKKRIEISP